MRLLLCLALLNEGDFTTSAGDVSLTSLNPVKRATLKGIVPGERTFFGKRLNKFEEIIRIEPSEAR